MRRAAALLVLVTSTLCLAEIIRLRPSDFPDLPPNIAQDLQRRGCAVPQVPIARGRQNVIKGEFAKPGQTDWAVLCTRNGSTTILVFWNGSDANPAQIETRKEQDSLQSWTNNKMVFSRKIDPVGKAYIMKQYEAFGGTKPPAIDHQGINDVFVGKASVVLYFHQGKWLQLTGDD